MEDKVAKAVLILVFFGTFSSALQTSAPSLSDNVIALLLTEMSNLKEEVGEVRANVEEWKKSKSSDIENWKKTLEDRVDHLEEVSKTKLARTTSNP